MAYEVEADVSLTDSTTKRLAEEIAEELLEENKEKIQDLIEYATDDMAIHAITIAAATLYATTDRYERIEDACDEALKMFRYLHSLRGVSGKVVK